MHNFREKLIREHMFTLRLELRVPTTRLLWRLWMIHKHMLNRRRREVARQTAQRIAADDAEVVEVAVESVHEGLVHTVVANF